MALDSDPHGDADDPVGTEPAGTEPTQTQAVPFNPFDDDEDEDAGTQAVAFNPFDDDEDEDDATGGGCRSAEGVSLQAEQRDASGLTVSGADGSDGAGLRLLPFKRR